MFEKLSERLRKKITIQENDCWLWVGAVGTHGYGVAYYNNKVDVAHRIIYKIIIGFIPIFYELHHKCCNKQCVNPNHLEITKRKTHEGNFASINAQKTHCINGHEFTSENTAIYRNGKKRQCRTCVRERAKEFHLKSGSKQI